VGTQQSTWHSGRAFLWQCVLQLKQLRPSTQLGNAYGNSKRSGPAIDLAFGRRLPLAMRFATKTVQAPRTRLGIRETPSFATAHCKADSSGPALDLAVDLAFGRRLPLAMSIATQTVQAQHSTRHLGDAFFGSAYCNSNSAGPALDLAFGLPLVMRIDTLTVQAQHSIWHLGDTFVGRRVLQLKQFRPSTRLSILETPFFGKVYCNSNSSGPPHSTRHSGDAFLCQCVLQLKQFRPSTPLGIRETPSFGTPYCKSNSSSP
jgi:hypothetical protein